MKPKKTKIPKAVWLKQLINFEDFIIESLKDPEEARLYLQVALEEYQEDGNAEALLLALQCIAKARGGLTKLAKSSDLSRQHLYRALSKQGNPRLDTFGAVLKGLGYRLSVEDNLSDSGRSAH